MARVNVYQLCSESCGIYHCGRVLSILRSCFFACPASCCIFHLNPFSQLLLLTPGSITSLQCSISPPDHVVVLTDPLLGKDTST